MIFTPFIIVSEDLENENIKLVYNTLTTSLITLPVKDYNRIFIDELYNEEEKIQLKKFGFLIDSKEDVLDELKRLKKRDFSKVSQIVTILTTTNCNARCYYCFENGIKHYDMSIETADAVIEFLSSIFPKKELGINWFGGEPLLNFSIVKYITEKLKNKGYNLKCHLTTNGSLLTSEMICYLKENYENITAQISIDDVDEKYGLIKRYLNINNKLAYSRVIQSISMLANNNILVSVRINFASTHIASAKQIYARVQNDLEKICPKKNLYIYFAPLSLSDPKENISRYKGNEVHPYLQAVKIQFEEGYPINRLKYPEQYDLLAAFGLMPHSFACGMCVENRYAIDANGDLYKCHRLVGKEKYKVGSVFDGLEKNDFYYKMYVTDDIIDNDCKNCNILPICQTGCKANRLLIGDFAKCHKIKQSQKELLSLYYKNLKKKGDSI